MNVELKPCPFCGGEARIDEGMRGYPCILCGTCGASSDYASTDDVSEAITAWNTRHDHSPDAGKVGEDAARYRALRQLAVSAWNGERPPIPQDKTPAAFDDWVDQVVEAARAGERG